MELTDFFKSYIDTEEQPVVICDLDYRIVYINHAAAEKYEKFGGFDLVGKPLRSFTTIEGESKINMVVEWFKESQENNNVFVLRDTSQNVDTYIISIRDGNGKLIGFANRKISRTPDDSKPYDII